MKLPRPYIPLSVCVQVAERQVQASGSPMWALYQSAQAINPWPLGRKLRVLLNDLFGDQHYQLDHDPALILRKFKRDSRKPMAAWFTPNANDPKYLLYRATTDHLQKTTGRKPGAERTVTTKGSDIGLKTKFARLERKPKRKSIIPSRPFSTQKRKLR
jgi:hypothetical protein